MAEFELLGGVAEVPRDVWNALVGDASPFLEWDWLVALEESGSVGGSTGWLPKPLVAREGGRVVAACPLYVKLHSNGEFVFDWGWADASERAGIRYYPKLLVGVPFTPVAGPRFLVAPGLDRPAWTRALAEAVRDLCERHELSGAHVNFCTEAEIEPLESAGYALRIGYQYHWHNRGYRDFDDYLDSFRSKRRNQIRRERRELERQDVRIETYLGSQIPDELFGTMYRFYVSTLDKKVYGRQYLEPAFFEKLASRFRERLCFVIAWLGDEPIAGTFNVQKGEALYGRYWGADLDVRNLHFNVAYYAAIEHCIRQGLARFEPGAGGDYKQTRGFDARATWSLHHLRDPRLRRAVNAFLVQERDEARRVLGWYADNSALKDA
jgi:uncharacterized protein